MRDISLCKKQIHRLHAGKRLAKHLAASGFQITWDFMGEVFLQDTSELSFRFWVFGGRLVNHRTSAMVHTLHLSWNQGYPTKDYYTLSAGGTMSLTAGSWAELKGENPKKIRKGGYWFLFVLKNVVVVVVVEVHNSSVKAVKHKAVKHLL